MIRTFFSYNFGCRVNEAEKEEIDRQLIKLGFQFNPKNPDIYIINSCCVTNKAEREVRQHIHKVKKKFPQAKIILTGCAATLWQKNNQKISVDLVIDNLNKKYLSNLILKKFYFQTNDEKKLSNKKMATSRFIESGRFLIKIGDGCHRFCSFCIVPYLRGLPQSISSQEIINKINNLEKNYPLINEVILTAINTEAYGYESKTKINQTKESLVNLIKTVIDKTSVPRISLGSIHPLSFDKEFFKFYQEYLPKKRLVNFFHIPIQSGSNKILTLMKRGYFKEEILEKINTLYKLNPMALIGTDIIVGFLEETDSDFEETYKFLKNSPISKFHIFPFSKRIGTAAYFMAKRLKEPSIKIKKERAQALRNLQQIKYQLFLEKHLNKTFSALFLANFSNNYQQALLDNQLPIIVKTEKPLPAVIKNVKIMEIKKGKLLAKIV